MIDTREDELQNVLEEGITALRAMRKGITHACGDMRIRFREATAHPVRTVDGENVGKRQQASGIIELTGPRMRRYS